MPIRREIWLRHVKYLTVCSYFTSKDHRIVQYTLFDFNGLDFADTVFIDGHDGQT